ncbi:MAG: transcriptional repressor [Thermoanaerobaculum sp.]|nr:transcriptional repressor [Thermoanaerobaculum sp.]
MTLEDMLVERMVKELKAHGHSITSQRIMIFRALARRRDHPTAEALYEQLVQDHVPELSLATVYKNLHVFEELGLVRAVASPDGKTRFDVPIAPHHHLFCTRCGVMVDVEDGVRVAVDPHLEENSGFEVTGVEVLVEGICASCRTSPGGARGWREARRQRKLSS